MRYHFTFTRWTISLVAQSRALSAGVAEKDPVSVRQIAATYEADLQLLYEYAHTHGIELIAYYEPFAEIEQCLLLVHEHLQQTYP